MKTNLVLALMAATTLLSACGGFQSSIGPAKVGGLSGPTKPVVELNASEKRLARLDGSEFKLKDPSSIPSITSLSLKLSGQAAPFQYQLTMTPKGLEQRGSTSEITTASDRTGFAIVSGSILVEFEDNDNCLSLTVPDQSESVLFNDVETLTAPIVVCK